MFRLTAILIVVSIVGCQALPQCLPFFSKGCSEHEELLESHLRETSLNENEREPSTNAKFSLPPKPDLSAGIKAATVLNRDVRYPRVKSVSQRFEHFEAIYEAMQSDSFTCSEEELKKLATRESVTGYPGSTIIEGAQKSFTYQLIYWFYVELFEQCSILITEQILNYKSIPSKSGSPRTDWQKLYSDMECFESALNQKQQRQRLRKSLLSIVHRSKPHLNIDPQSMFPDAADDFGSQDGEKEKRILSNKKWGEFLNEHCGRIDKEEPLRKIFQWGWKVAVEGHTFSRLAKLSADPYPDVLAYYKICEDALKKWNQSTASLKDQSQPEEPSTTEVGEHSSSVLPYMKLPERPWKLL